MKATFIISSERPAGCKEASVKDRFSSIATAIPSSRSLTPTSFRSAGSWDEITKIASMKIWAIPGFLGLASDWDHLTLPNLKKVDPFVFPWSSPAEWGSSFNHCVQKERGNPNLIMGYSLGGRLALHALVDHPDLWDGAVIVSAHTGMACELDKAKRFKNDQRWADRFLHEEWDQMLRDWNAQSVFQPETFHFTRNEMDFNREELAHTLIYASQGLQRDLKASIEALNLPQLWIVGEYDQRYATLAQGLTLRHPLSCVVVLPGACHRIPWSHPEIYQDLVWRWLRTCLKLSDQTFQTGSYS